MAEKKMLIAQEEELTAKSENLYLCAINEGDLYRYWIACGQAQPNTPDSVWADEMRIYARRLVKEGRATKEELAAKVIIKAAARVRDYYLAHIKEL